jgi:hypothetical protein
VDQNTRLNRFNNVALDDIWPTHCHELRAGMLHALEGRGPYRPADPTATAVNVPVPPPAPAMRRVVLDHAG